MPTHLSLSLLPVGSGQLGVAVLCSASTVCYTCIVVLLHLFFCGPAAGCVSLPFRLCVCVLFLSHFCLSVCLSISLAACVCAHSYFSLPTLAEASATRDHSFSLLTHSHTLSRTLTRTLSLSLSHTPTPRSDTVRRRCQLY